MTYKTITVHPITPHIGAEVTGVDLSGPLSNSQVKDIHQAWLDHMVLVFRGQIIDREAHKRFGRHFGKLHVHPMNATRSGDDEILIVKTTKDSPYTAGNGWHTDVTCDEVPPMGSMLYITEMPEPGCGGDTVFADMYLAYELLSDRMKSFLEGLTATHDGGRPYQGSYNVLPPDGKAWPKNTHPVVVKHPETGRKLLYVNSGFTTKINELSPAESHSVLSFLFAHISENLRLTCRVPWQANTLTFWDNRCTQHHAIWDYHPHSRYGERVSIVGKDRPE